MSFTVIWGRGGRENTVWIALHEEFQRREVANEKRDELARMGYPSYVYPTYEPGTTKRLAIPMPEGPAPDWDYESLCWKKDKG